MAPAMIAGSTQKVFHWAMALASRVGSMTSGSLTENIWASFWPKVRSIAGRAAAMAAARSAWWVTVATLPKATW